MSGWVDCREREGCTAINQLPLQDSVISEPARNRKGVNVEHWPKKSNYSFYVSLIHRARNKCMQILLSRVQEGPSKEVKQEREVLSPNHVGTIISGTVILFNTLIFDFMLISSSLSCPKWRVSHEWLCQVGIKRQNILRRALIAWLSQIPSAHQFTSNVKLDTPLLLLQTVS